MTASTLSGDWTGIVGGTNIGRITARFDQRGDQLYGQFIFQDLVVVPVAAELTGMIDGEWIDATLGNVKAVGNPANIPANAMIPAGGRVMGLVEQDKITGFWITNVGTNGSFILKKA